MTYKEAYVGRSETILEQIETDNDVFLGFNKIDFEPFGNPTIAVDSSARFAVHEIIGGTTIRQKIGEDPREIEVSGVCNEEVSRKLAQLHKAKYLSLNSAVIDDIVRCQIASVSTDPLEDGGAADMDKGDFLYDFTINLVEIEVFA